MLEEKRTGDVADSADAVEAGGTGRRDRSIDIMSIIKDYCRIVDDDNGCPKKLLPNGRQTGAYVENRLKRT